MNLPAAVTMNWPPLGLVPSYEVPNPALRRGRPVQLHRGPVRPNIGVYRRQSHHTPGPPWM